MKATVIAAAELPHTNLSKPQAALGDAFRLAECSINLCSWREADRSGGSVDFTLVTIEVPDTELHISELNTPEGPLVAFTDGRQDSWAAPSVVRATNESLAAGRSVVFKFLTGEAALACRLSLRNSAERHAASSPAIQTVE